MDVRLQGLTNFEPPLYEDLVRDLVHKVPQALALYNFPLITWPPSTRLSSPLWVANTHIFGGRGFKDSHPLLAFPQYLAMECNLDICNPITGEQFSDYRRRTPRCAFPSYVLEQVAKLLQTRPPPNEMAKASGSGRSQLRHVGARFQAPELGNYW